MNELNMKEWLEPRTVYLCIAGSHAYGMNTDESDHDIRGACIAPQRYYYGLEQFEQSDKKGNLDYYNTLLKKENYVDPELVVWDIRKFVHLASKGNPNMIELLFLDPKFYVYVHPIFQKILDNREWFLSKKLRYRFGGYANNQLKRMRNHYRWLHSPPTHQPTRDEFGIQLGKYKLPEDQLQAARTVIQRLVDSWLVDETELDPDLRIQLGYDMKKLIEIVCTELKIEHEEIHIKDELYFAAVKQLGFDSNFMEYLHREKAYHIALEDWNHYQKWLKDRNPKRAALEAKFGFDSKHGSHLYRLLDTCIEFFETGQMNVTRPNADYLKAIREEGVLTYDEIIEWAEQAQKKLDELVSVSTLRKDPKRTEISELLTECINEYMYYFPSVRKPLNARIEQIDPKEFVTGWGD